MEHAFGKLRDHIGKVDPPTNEEWQKIASCFRPLELRKDEVLVNTGERVITDHWVVRGCLKAEFSDYQGKDHILQFATENWWISDYAAFFKGEKARFRIDCLEDSLVLAISFEDRMRLYKEVPAFKNFFLEKLTNGFVSLQNRILSILSNNPREQYEEFLRLYPDMSQRIPKKYIARYLGVSRETLSRLYR